MKKPVLLGLIMFLVFGALLSFGMRGAAFLIAFAQEEIKMLAPSDDKTCGEGNGYIGTTACKKCHADMVKIWMEKRHYQATADVTRDPKEEKCFKCHNIDLDVVGKVRKDPKLQERCYKCHKVGSPETPGVDCEACHGPAFLHSKTSPKDLATRDYAKGKILKPNEDKCTTCHNKECKHFKKFDFKEFYEKIQHKLPPPED